MPTSQNNRVARQIMIMTGLDSRCESENGRP